ncbi:Beta-porphyranase [Melia azedarach]|uniref:Beta-porphyranase n=1 Tax=Melia azedarach TaxID=155640 RepID=A0ACC1XJ02_MELAZ|nr:Beta-porphyranase [Melia azedarach]
MPHLKPFWKILNKEGGQQNQERWQHHQKCEIGVSGVLSIGTMGIVRNGYLDCFMDAPRDKKRAGQNQRPQTIVIAEGPTLASDSNNARKNYSRMSVRLDYPTQVFNVQTQKKQKTPSTLIMFTNEDENDVIYPQNDAIVVSMNIAGFNINRIFIDPGSSVDILFKRTVDELGIQQLELEPFHTPLYGFEMDKLHRWVELSCL